MNLPYFDFIKSLFTSEEFDDLLDGIPLEDDPIDVSPGSGFHDRLRYRKSKLRDSHPNSKKNNNE